MLAGRFSANLVNLDAAAALLTILTCGHSGRILSVTLSAPPLPLLELDELNVQIPYVGHRCHREFFFGKLF